jgi:hypothetical protein
MGAAWMGEVGLPRAVSGAWWARFRWRVAPVLVRCPGGRLGGQPAAAGSDLRRPNAVASSPAQRQVRCRRRCPRRP